MLMMCRIYYIVPNGSFSFCSINILIYSLTHTHAHTYAVVTQLDKQTDANKYNNNTYRVKENNPTATFSNFRNKYYVSK